MTTDRDLESLNEQERALVNRLRGFRLADPPGELRERIEGSLRSEKAQPAVLTPRAAGREPGRGARLVARFTKRGWLLRIASAITAAALVAAVAWRLVGNVEPAAADFAGMLRQIRQAISVSYEETFCIPGQPETKVEVVMALPGRMRMTYSDGKICIYPDAQGECLVMNQNTQTARLMRLQVGTKDNEPLESLRRADVAAGRFTGNETLDGCQVAVYQVARQSGTIRVWVEPDTELPVQIEVRFNLHTGGEGVRTLHNFAWNQPVSEALFSLTPPAGYAYEDLQAKPTEVALVELLRTCAKLNDGAFPDKLDAQTAFTLVMRSSALNSQQAQADAVPGFINFEGDDDPAKQTYRTCLRGLAFVEQINANGTWKYAGAGVKLGDPSALVCWWKPAGAASFRAVYGNLQVKDVPAELLPQATTDEHRPAPLPTEEGAG